MIMKQIFLAALFIYTTGISAQVPVQTVYKKGGIVLSAVRDDADSRFTLSSGKNKNSGSSGSNMTIAESDAPGLFRLLSALRDFVLLKEDRPMTLRLSDSVYVEKRSWHTESIWISVQGSAGHMRLSKKELEELFGKFTAWCDKNDIDYYRNTPAVGLSTRE
ncbi:hypothetical protein JCM30204_41250 [Dysgonomonas termitidis]